MARTTYEQIAEAVGYSLAYVMRNVGVEFWRLLSQALGEPVSKTSFQAVVNGDIEQFLQQNTILFNGLRRLLEQQLERLSYLEHSCLSSLTQFVHP